MLVRVVINGVGKLGNAILSASKATETNGEDHVQVVAGVDANPNTTDSIPIYASLDDVEEEFDVVIDASRAEAVPSVLNFAIANNKPVVIAATGHTDDQLALVEEASSTIPIFQASNLSLGVSVIRRLVEAAGRMLGSVDAEIIETHHRMKVDAPSGTALTLAEALRDSTNPGRDFVYGRTPADVGARGGEIGIHALRGGTVVGEHTVRFLLDDEIVEISHVAQSRQVFGFGAVRAAEFIASQQAGLYGMEELIG